MESIISADGSRIAFDLLGEGPPLIIIGGATCTRQISRPLAEAFAGHARVLNHDRRGRVDSDDRTGSPWPVAREVEDLAALIEVVGSPATRMAPSCRPACWPESRCRHW